MSEKRRRWTRPINFSAMDESWRYFDDLANDWRARFGQLLKGIAERDCRAANVKFNATYGQSESKGGQSRLRFFGQPLSQKLYFVLSNALPNP
jgi:hypothetical protein